MIDKRRNIEIIQQRSRLQMLRAIIFSNQCQFFKSESVSIAN